MSAADRPTGLASKKLGVSHLLFFTISASAPMTVLAGGVLTTYAVTGSPGVPLSFLIIGVSLGLFVIGYSSMSRYVSNAGAFYAYITHGLGRPPGVAGAFIALAAYNSIQIGLYGLFGAVLSGFLEDNLGLSVHWAVLSFMAIAVIGVFGTLKVNFNARILACLLLLEILAMVLFDVAAVGNPAEPGPAMTGFRWSDLFEGAGAGAVLAFGVAGFVGFESGATYGEEVKDRNRTVAVATYWALAVTSILYAASAWALLRAVGASSIQSSALENGSALVFDLMAAEWSPLVGDLVALLFITSVFAALLSFHSNIARYFFALGREGVLFRYLSRTSIRTWAPVAGSVTQSVIALLVVTVFVVSGLDPVFQLFTWLSYVGAIGILVLMIASCLAVIGFFWPSRGHETLIQRVIAPAGGAVSLLVILYLVLTEASSILGTSGPTWLSWAIPVIIFVIAISGLAWGFVLKSRRPSVYRAIGRGYLAGQETFGDQRTG